MLMFFGMLVEVAKVVEVAAEVELKLLLKFLGLLMSAAVVLIVVVVEVEEEVELWLRSIKLELLLLLVLRGFEVLGKLERELPPRLLMLMPVEGVELLLMFLGMLVEVVEAEVELLLLLKNLDLVLRELHR